MEPEVHFDRQPASASPTDDGDGYSFAMKTATEGHGGDDGTSSEVKYPNLLRFSEWYTGVHGYIAAVVCLWGIVANLANIVVLTRPKMV